MSVSRRKCVLRCVVGVKGGFSSVGNKGLLKLAKNIYMNSISKWNGILHVRMKSE